MASYAGFFTWVRTLAGVEPARFMSFDPTSGSWDDSLPPHPIGSQAAYMAAHDGEVWVACGGVIIGPSNPQNKGEARQYNVRDQCYSPCDFSCLVNRADWLGGGWLSAARSLVFQARRRWMGEEASDALQQLLGCGMVISR